MKTGKSIQIVSLSVLLLYLFSNSPFIIFHHHTLVHQYQNDADQQSVNNPQSTSVAIQSSADKCALCDNHTVSPHIIFDTTSLANSTCMHQEYQVQISNYFSSETCNQNNRGPPASISPLT